MNVSFCHCIHLGSRIFRHKAPKVLKNTHKLKFRVHNIVPTLPFVLTVVGVINNCNMTGNTVEKDGIVLFTLLTVR
jgi:hypothetical protein